MLRDLRRGARTWVLLTLPPRARWLIGVVDALFVAAIFDGIVTTSWRASDLLTFGVLISCGMVSIEVSLRLVWRGPRPGRAVNDLLAVWTIPVVLLLPPLYAVLAAVPLSVLGQYRVTKRPPVKLLFSISAAGLANFVAATLRTSVMGDARPDLHALVGTPGAVALVISCVVVRYFVNMSMVAEIVAMTTPAARVRDSFTDLDAWGAIAAEGCTCVLVAMACTASPFAVLFAVAPVLVLQRTLLLAEFREAARTDSKTSLANASYWREVADRALSRARGGREPLAVLLVDIDHFKAVNDRYGHLVGDDVLRSVANGLTHGLRPGDFVGRFGGEEFVVLLPGSDLEQARHAAERIRAHVAELSVEASNRREPVHVTISIGAAAFRESGHSVHELLDAADTALYAAKHAGRNCVRVAEGSRQQVLDLTADSGRAIDLRSHHTPVE
ncbi:MAG: diguanylate cyclase [Acidothermaceae bacterium]